jgi:hypothetical protein
MAENIRSVKLGMAQVHDVGVKGLTPKYGKGFEHEVRGSGRQGYPATAGQASKCKN